MPIPDQFPTIDPAALSRTLKDELERQGLGYRAFQQRVAEEVGGVRGSSYGAVYSYVTKPPRHPRPDIVRGMARVLGVLYSYLATGQGPRTGDEAVAQEHVEAEQPPEIRRFFAALELRSSLYQQVAAYTDIRQSIGWLAYRIGIPFLADESTQDAAIEALDQLLGIVFVALCPDRGAFATTSYLRAMLTASHEAVDLAEALWEGDDDRRDEGMRERVERLLLFAGSDEEERTDE